MKAQCFSEIVKGLVKGGLLKQKVYLIMKGKFDDSNQNWSRKKVYGPFKDYESKIGITILQNNSAGDSVSNKVGFDNLSSRLPPWANGRFTIIYIYICIYSFSVCLGVCLWSINVNTAEPIGPKFCTGPHMTPGKVYGYANN